ncbi:MAG TPA: hypothetical protein VFH70_02515 [Acidimicrobiales bacterium]|nr:hypothetical protein [Acidimicrobiales bacterium]
MRDTVWVFAGLADGDPGCLSVEIVDMCATSSAGWTGVSPSSVGGDLSGASSWPTCWKTEARSAGPGWRRLSMPVPALFVDTSEGYDPALDEIVTSITRRAET